MNQPESSTTAAQNKNIVRTILVLVGIIALFLSLFLHKMLSPRILSEPELLANGAVEFSKPRIIPPFELIDAHGKPFTLEQLTGKWTIVFFGFTSCPDICPVTLSILSKWHKTLDQDIQTKTQVVMISVDPARDTPEALRGYMEHFNPDFIGVTGELRNIRILADQLNVAFNRSSADEDYSVDHSGHLVIVNPYGHYHGILKPPFELARLKLTFQSIVTMFD
jgi:protein SCO1